MDLDRGVLAKIDRRILATLGRDEAYRIVRVPASEATWSIWKRYCAALEVSMGRGIAGLISHELGTIAGLEFTGGRTFGTDLQDKLMERTRVLDARDQHLDERERAIKEAERRLRARTKPVETASSGKVGRNDPCPCGSAFKYKRCHGA